MVVKHIPGNVDMESVIQEMARKVVKVGYFENSRYPDGAPVAGVAVVQEFGSVKMKIPPRPTFRPAINDNKAKHRDGIAATFRRAVAGTQTVEQGLSQLGQVVVGDIQQNIRDLSDPELSESTIRARARRHHAGGASSKPLVDTGTMLQSVTFVVEDS